MGAGKGVSVSLRLGQEGASGKREEERARAEGPGVPGQGQWTLRDTGAVLVA